MPQESEGRVPGWWASKPRNPNSFEPDVQSELGGSSGSESDPHVSGENASVDQFSSSSPGGESDEHSVSGESIPGGHSNSSEPSDSSEPRIPSAQSPEPGRFSEGLESVAPVNTPSVMKEGTTSGEPETNQLADSSEGGAQNLGGSSSRPSQFTPPPSSEPVSATQDITAGSRPGEEPVEQSEVADTPTQVPSLPDTVVGPSGSDQVPVSPNQEPSPVEPVQKSAEPAVEREYPELKTRPLPRTIAIANQKGGVGKTTTSVNLGAALAEQDHRVLVVDLDPQGNATTGLGINSRALDNSIYDVLLNDLPMEDCVESTSVLNLFIAPASLDLAGAEIELVPAFSREMRLRNALNEVKQDYDYVLIDCPPSLGLLTVNALAAADEVMVPIQCEYYALEGLGQLIRNINLVQKNLNPALELSSIVLVMYDGRTNLAAQVSGEVREHFGPVVCRNVIPRNIRLSEAPSYGQPITTFDSSSKGAVAYRELAREVNNVSA